MPDQPSSQSVFQEVLELSLDTQQFDAALQKIEEQWNAAMERMNEAAPNAASVFGGDQLAGIEGQLGELTAAIAQVQNADTEATASFVANAQQHSEAIANVSAQLDQLATAQEKAAATSAESGGFLSGIGGDLGRVAEILVLWRAVGVAIDGVIAAAEVLPNAFKEGVAYLDDLQNNAVKLQGAIAQNITFSSDLTQNFREAGIAAQSVVKQLQDVADKTQIPFEQLTMAFRALLNSGGGAMASDMQQLVQLTQMFALAMQASGRDVMAARSLVSELPKLMDGTVTSTSKLLEVLHLTVPQWEAIRQHALEHHDLLAQLEPLMRPYLSAVQDAAMRHSVVSAELERQKQRAEAAFATPLLERWNSLLQDINGWLNRNDGTVNQLASDTGNLATALAKLMAPESMNDSGEGLKDLAVGADVVVNAFRVLVSILEQVKKEFVDFDSLGPITEKVLTGISDLLHGHVGKAKADLDDLQSYIKNRFAADVAEVQQTYVEAATDVAKALTVPAQPQSTNPYLHGNGPTDSAQAAKERLAQLKAEFQQERELLRSNSESAVNDIKKDLADRKITLEEGTAQLIAVYKAEAQSMQAAADAFAKSASLTGAKPQDVQKFQQQAQKAALDMAAAAGKAEAAAYEENAKDQQRAEDVKDKAIEAIALAHQKAMLAIIKQQAAEGLATHEQAALSEIALMEREHAARQQRLQDDFATANTATATAQVKGKMAEEEQAFDDAMLQAQRQLTQARRQDLAEQQAQAEKMAELRGKEREDEDQALAQFGEGYRTQKEALVDLAKAKLEMIEVERAHALAALATAEAAGEQGKKLDALRVKAESLRIAQEQAQFEVDVKQSSVDFLGRNDNGNYTLSTELETAAKNLTSIFNELTSSVKNVISTYQRGGMLAAVGAGTSAVGGVLSQASDVSSPMGSLFDALGISSDALGPIGAGMSLVGDLVGGLSSIFQAAAKNIANDVKQTFDTIMNEYQQGNQNLVQTIAALQTERQTAIDQLSGVKGGEKELQQLLPQMNNQIASLIKQQHQIIGDFYNNVQDLIAATNPAEGQVFVQNFKTWEQAFQTVKQFLGAGGSPQAAISFLDMTKVQEVNDLQQQWLQGEDQAIQDAFKLNDLMLQRQQLMEKLAALANSVQDSIVRREAGAITAGQQLATQKAQYEQQLEQVNQDIAVTQHKWEVEQKIYGLTSDIAQLHQIDAQVQEKSVDYQLQKYTQIANLLKDLQGLSAIVTPGGVGFASANGGPGQGTYGLGGMPGAGAVPGNNTFNININAPNGTNPAKPSDFAHQLEQELRNRFLSGRTMYGAF